MAEYSPYHGSKSKRGFDIFTAGVLTATSLPLEGLAIAYLSNVLDVGDIYFRQARENIDVLKLRTMLDCPETQTTYNRNNARIPSRGARLIREARIDELPQLRLVLKGVMSMAGYRPMPETYKDSFREHLSAAEFKEWTWSRQGPVKPGLTGMSQLLTLSQEVHDADLCLTVAEADIRYAREASLPEDLRLLAQTPSILGRHLLGHAMVVPAEA